MTTPFHDMTAECISKAAPSKSAFENVDFLASFFKALSFVKG